MINRWKLLSSSVEVSGSLPALSVEFLALVTAGSATTYTGTIDCSSVTSSDSLIILTQAEAGGGATNNVVNNITANATSMITDIAATNSTGAAHTGIFRVEGSAVAGDSTTDISMTYNNGMARQSFIAYRLINGSSPTLGDTDDTQTVSTNPITSTVNATTGDVIFSSAYFSDNSGHDFSISNGTLTETDGVQAGPGSGGGMFSTDAVGSVTVSYTNSGAPNTQGDAIVTAVYTGSGGGGGGGGSDFTPDAVNWNNINETDPNVPHDTNTQTISGIDTTITLEVSFPQNDDQYFVGAYSGINGTGSLYDGASAVSPGSFTFDVVNGGLVTFRTQILGGGDRVRGDTVTIVNTSDGNAVLDTFSITIEN